MCGGQARSQENWRRRGEGQVIWGGDREGGKFFLKQSRKIEEI